MPPDPLASIAPPQNNAGNISTDRSHDNVDQEKIKVESSKCGKILLLVGQELKSIFWET